jgi:hypothetical protein
LHVTVSADVLGEYEEYITKLFGYDKASASWCLRLTVHFVLSVISLPVGRTRARVGLPRHLLPYLEGAARSGQILCFLAVMRDLHTPGIKEIAKVLGLWIPFKDEIKQGRKTWAWIRAVLLYTIVPLS